jgi:hypothetical protein
MPSPPPPLGDPARRPQVELCVIHHTKEIIAEERALERFRGWFMTCFSIPGDSVTIRRYHPEDFLITFSYAVDMLCVLHDPPPASALFMLVSKHWHHQAMASAENLFYKVTLRLQGIPAHTRNLSTTRKLLSTTCSNVRRMTTTLTKADLGCMTVVAWCIRLDLIPIEKILYVSEPDVVLSQGLLLFIESKEVTFHNQPTLWYYVSSTYWRSWIGTRHLFPHQVVARTLTPIAMTINIPPSPVLGPSACASPTGPWIRRMVMIQWPVTAVVHRVR